MSYIFYFTFQLNVHCSCQLRDIKPKVFFGEPFDYDISYRQLGPKKADGEMPPVSYIFYFTFQLNVHCSCQLRDIKPKVFFGEPFDYDISYRQLGPLTHPLSSSPSTDHGLAFFCKALAPAHRLILYLFTKEQLV